MSAESSQWADAGFVSVEGENSLSMEQSAIPAKSLLNTSREVTVRGAEMRIAVSSAKLQAVLGNDVVVPLTYLLWQEAI
ncbi:hypothetical protein [Pararhizobium sp. A13]|uniref:hypothetical protein n=1 Tax=Pararhizobium sp. A13 TaxID=3133975 RepID=UPI00324DB7E0